MIHESLQRIDIFMLLRYVYNSLIFVIIFLCAKRKPAICEDYLELEEIKQY